MQVSGTTARLTADILDNDSAGARRAAARIRGSVDDAVMKKIDAEINNRDKGRVLAQDLTGGTRGKVKALNPPKFRAQNP